MCVIKIAVSMDIHLEIDKRYNVAKICFLKIYGLPRFGVAEFRNDESLCRHTEPLQKGEVSILANYESKAIRSLWANV